MGNDVRTEEVIERFCACDYCGTKVKIDPTEPADTLCPTCGAKRHEVIEKRIVNHPAPTQQPQTPSPSAPQKRKWVWNFQQAGKVLLFLLVLLIITLIVYKIRGIW